MILTDVVNKLLRDCVDLITSTPGLTNQAKQREGGRPSGKHATVDFVNETSIGWEQKTLTNSGEDLIETITGFRELMFTVAFYNEGYDLARQARLGFVRSSIQSLFTSAGVALGRRSAVIDSSQPYQNGYERRAQFDIVLNMVSTDTDTIKAINTLNIAGEFQSRGLTYLFNQEVTL